LNSFLAAAIVSACLFGAVLLGMGLRRLLPAHHLSDDTKDTVKLAMGLVATMAALVLGLLVSSAKSDHDTGQSDVSQMAAKVAFLDRVLADDGRNSRRMLRHAVNSALIGAGCRVIDVGTEEVTLPSGLVVKDVSLE